MSSLNLHLLRNTQQEIARLCATDGTADAVIGHTGLLALASLWKSTPLRLLLTARYLPLELHSLLRAVHAPAGEGSFGGLEATEAAQQVCWCEARLEELIAGESPLALIEALISLLRQLGAPPWLRAASASLLTRCVLRPEGVRSLVVALCAHRSTEADLGTAQLHAVRLLSSVPSTMSAAAYVEALAEQIWAVLDAPDAWTGDWATSCNAATAASTAGAAPEMREEADTTQRAVRAVVAMATSTLAQRHGQACQSALVAPMMAALHARAERQACERSIHRLFHLLVGSKKPSAGLCNLLLKAGALAPLLDLASHAHLRHTREGADAEGAEGAQGGGVREEGSSAGDVLTELAAESTRAVRHAETCLEALLVSTPRGVEQLASDLAASCEVLSDLVARCQSAYLSPPRLEASASAQARVRLVLKLGGHSTAANRVLAALAVRMLSGALRAMCGRAPERIGGATGVAASTAASAAASTAASATASAAPASSPPPSVGAQLIRPLASQLLVSGTDEERLRPAASQPLVDRVNGANTASSDEEASTTATEAAARLVAATLQLLDGLEAAALTEYLRSHTAPALELLRAVLPAALAAADALVADADIAAAAAERLSICVTVVHLLLPSGSGGGSGGGGGGSGGSGGSSGGGGGGSSGVSAVSGVSGDDSGAEGSRRSLREGLRELLPMLVRASHAPLLDSSTQAKALAASIGVATLPTDNDDGGSKSGVPAGASANETTGSMEDADARAALRGAVADMASDTPVVRAGGIATLRALLQRRSRAVVAQLPLLVELCEAQLSQRGAITAHTAATRPHVQMARARPRRTSCSLVRRCLPCLL